MAGAAPLAFFASGGVVGVFFLAGEAARLGAAVFVLGAARFGAACLESVFFAADFFGAVFFAERRVAMRPSMTRADSRRS